ncbi:homeobox-domain-containing protein [Backusella circina FSU 941]|nr:homeobox-domain-containing protein [Backusella circina FSU 941]
MDSDNSLRHGPSPSSSLSQELKINARSPSNEEDSASARKRTRASPDQLAVLEKTFSLNPSPNNRVREQLSQELNMSERSIQIWFQNRRAKVKNIAKKTSILYDETMKIQQYAIAAANAACQAAAFNEQQASPGTPMKTNPDLYYYYYYYYFNYRQQEQQQQRQKQARLSQNYSQTSSNTTAPTPPPPASMMSIPPPPPPPPPIPASFSVDRPSSPSNTFSSDTSPQTQPWTGKQLSYQGVTRTRAHTIGPGGYQEYMKNKHVDRGNSADFVQSFSPYDASNYGYISNYNTPIPQPQPPQPQPQPQPQPRSSSSREAASNASNRTDIPPNEPLNLIQTDNTMSMSPQQQLPFYNQPQQINWDSSPIPHPVGSSNPSSSSFTNYNTMPYEDPSNRLIFSVSAIKIGTWKRVGYQSQDLLCFFDNQKLAFSWCICDGAQRYKIEFGQNVVQSIKLEQLQGRAGWARLEIQVIPNLIYFYMESATQNTWSQCRDYTEDKQATSVKYHQLDGPILSLKEELDQLVQLNPVLKSMIIQTDIYPSSLTDRSEQ